MHPPVLIYGQHKVTNLSKILVRLRIFGPPKVVVVEL